MFQTVIRQNMNKFRSLNRLSGLLHMENQIVAKQTASFTTLFTGANHKLDQSILSHGRNCVSTHLSIARYCDAPAEGEKKKKKPKKNPAAVEHVGRLDLRVGRIVEVKKAADAETLYLTKVDCGEGYNREIVAGIAQYLPAEELKDRLVVVLCNLKASKLRGHLSEGMIMCAKGTDAMEPIIPPEGAKPGDLVHCENYERTPVETPRSRQKLFDPIAEHLKTNEELIACYDGSYLYVPDKGSVVTKSLKNVNIA